MATDWAALTRDAAVRKGHPSPDHYVNQIRLESANFSEDVIYCRFINSVGALGIAQLMPQFYPRSCACDPMCALDLSLDTMISNIKKYGNETLALIAYNWGPGNMADRWDGSFSDLPSETQNYLDIIVGRGQALADLGQKAVEDFRIGPDVPDDVIRQTDSWSCAVRASYAAIWIIDQLEKMPPSPYTWWSNIMVPKYDTPDTGTSQAQLMGA